MMTSDIVIIGGGLAGAVSALKSREQGKDVLLLRKAWGATALGSGCFDIAGDILRIPGRPWGDSRDIGKNFSEIHRRCEHHPYAVITEDGLRLMKNGGDWLFGLLKRQGYEMRGSWEKNSLLPTVMGETKATAFGPVAFISGNLFEMKGAHVLFCSISGLSDFNPGFLSRSLYDSLKGTPYEWNKAEHTEVPLRSRITQPLTSQEAAAVLDDPEVSHDFTEGIKWRAGGKGYTHIFFPPVMGLTRWKENLAAMERSTGARCAEVFPLSPSVPGMRLQRAVDSLLADAGVKMVHGAVTGYTHEDGRITGLTLKMSEMDESCKGKAYVLATGRFIGGGIKALPRGTTETIFGLPVIPRETSMYSGVQVNSAMRPCDDTGRAIYANLFCAGSVVGGYDPAGEMCGSGVAMLTGSIAGENASQVTA